MSYHYWSIDGYGICADDISTTKERILRLVHEAPRFEEVFLKWIESTYEKPASSKEVELEDLLEYEDDCCYMGLAAIMQAVIEEKEHICLTVADDFDNVSYLLFEPRYPWSLGTKEESDSTEESLRLLYSKYVRILTDQSITVRYHSVENGG